MTTPEKIIKKLDSELYPELNSEMIYKLANESERGAILIGTAKIEEFLKKFIEKILPQESKKYKNRLLEYPGPLSSFSSKIELLYAFRYINLSFYNSLNVLRKLRNDAAHSYDNFELEKEKQKIEEINNFVDEDLSYVIEKLSLNNMSKIKKYKGRKVYLEKNLEVDENYLEESISKFIETEEGLKQHRIWKLSYGIVFMCLYVLVLIDENDFLNDKSVTLPNINLA